MLVQLFTKNISNHNIKFRKKRTKSRSLLNKNNLAARKVTTGGMDPTALQIDQSDSFLKLMWPEPLYSNGSGNEIGGKRLIS